MTSKNETAASKKKRIEAQTIDLNERFVALQQYLPPGATINSFEARVNAFMQMLVDLGVINEHNLLDLELNHLNGIEGYIKSLEDELEKQKKASRLILPNSGLTLPGN